MNGERLPASYANFYIANGVVLVPTFNDPNDRVALNAIAELIPDRHVVGIHAVDLVWGFGTLHCLTQQQPAAERERFSLIDGAHEDHAACRRRIRLEPVPGPMTIEARSADEGVLALPHARERARDLHVFRDRIVGEAREDLNADDS